MPQSGIRGLSLNTYICEKEIQNIQHGESINIFIFKKGIMPLKNVKKSAMEELKLHIKILPVGKVSGYWRGWTGLGTWLLAGIKTIEIKNIEPNACLENTSIKISKEKKRAPNKEEMLRTLTFLLRAS